MPANKTAAKIQEKALKHTAGAKRRPSVASKERTQAIVARSRQDRLQNDCRQQEMPVKVDHRSTECQVKMNRRRQIDPTTCERDYSSAEVEFMSALDDYKRRNGRMFPTCSEILEVLKALGYEKRVELPTVLQPSVPVMIPATATEQAV